MQYSTDDIRNIALVGNTGTGKTMLAEAILHAGGAIASPGSLERGETVSDFDPREQRLQHSVKPAVCHLEHSGVHVNLLDTPGSRDFLGRSLSMLTAVETLLIVIDAHVGVDSVAQHYMNVAAERGLCRMIVVNKIDGDGVDLAGVTDDIQTIFGPHCRPLNLPAKGGEEIVDCFFRPGDIEPDFDTVASAHTKIVDQVVEVDEDLMELYLEQGESITPDQLHDPFEEALREGHLVPICFVSARSGTGVVALLDIIERLMPSPREGNPPLFEKGVGPEAEPVVVKSDPDGHVIAHVFKVDVDPFRGRLGVFRIHQGVIHTGDRLLVGEASKAIKVSHLLKLNGKTQVEVDQAIPGDICAIPRADELHIDAVLHDSPAEEDFHIKSVSLPEPVFGLSINTQSDSDAQKVADALHTVEAEDPSIRVEHIATLNETVLRGTSEVHLKDVIEEIEGVYNVQIDTAAPGIAYRETITTSAEGHCRHKKQTGGAGQFGEVFLRVEPLKRGAGFEFDNQIVGGVIPSQFIPAVEKGVRQVMESGAIAGYPLQDIRVAVYDGKHHPVDSKEVAFVQAGKKAFLDAIAKARPVVMEPIVNVTGDLAGMGGSINGTNILEDGTAEISGQAPLREVQSYHSRLKSHSSGEGSFTMEFSHYSQVQDSLQKELMAAYRPVEED
ncbi:MAG: elongation factor G [Gammaproteobacteria bacterium]